MARILHFPPRTYDAAAEQQRLAREYERMAEPPKDYPERIRYVRPIRSDNIARILGDPDALIDLYRSREEAERIDRLVADLKRDDALVKRWQRRVAVGIVVLLYAILFIVSFQIGRAF